MNTPTRLGLICLTLALPLSALAQFTLVQVGGTFRSDATDLSLVANGGTAIGQDEYGAGTHYIANINNGTYGNASSWLGAAESSWEYGSWVGVSFATPETIDSFAFGRDNTGVYTDRFASAPYVIQYTTSLDLSNADWIKIGTIDYAGTDAVIGAQRHLYNLDTELTDVTAFRIYTSSGGGAGNAIDELELYSTAAVPEPATYAALAGIAALGVAVWRRRSVAAC